LSKCNTGNRKAKKAGDWGAEVGKFPYKINGVKAMKQAMKLLKKLTTIKG
jgi:hypothetical protein